MPCSEAAWARVDGQYVAKELGQPLTSDRVVLFGGPMRLAAIADTIANARNPPPELMICHRLDYRDSGLGSRCGPTAFFMTGRYTRAAPFLQSMTVPPPLPQKAMLEPDWSGRCPRGELWVIR